jgi:hypothetical protein
VEDHKKLLEGSSEGLWKKAFKSGGTEGGRQQNSDAAFHRAEAEVCGEAGKGAAGGDSHRFVKRVIVANTI